MPPAIRATRLLLCARVVSPPYGPSATTNVPAWTSLSLAVKSPSDLTVIRNDLPLGACERENGWDSNHRFRSRNAIGSTGRCAHSTSRDCAR